MDSAAGRRWQTALLVDLGLLALFALFALFALEHSMMARPTFKRVPTRFVAPVIERSTYVLASGVALLYAGFAFGWDLLLITTLAIDHFHLFGLRQVWRNLRAEPQQGLEFVMPVLADRNRRPGSAESAAGTTRQSNYWMRSTPPM